ncbi:hypothetical protein IU459_26965 [Nocardia amamiensis]|uniref:Uncharacterized protein n=1 Tax=Nocardia amamiensis TaxID=404578 RepID=A0ABS0CZI9_9NOCA|nr:hypothetical protein [Nocardia amamiensis]MBF6301157.1 hypothetical protein [Nocardia amamiensis]
MTSLPEALGLAAASFITGVLVGQFVRFRRVDAGDRHLLKPELDRRPFSGPWFKAGIAVLFLAAVGLMVHANSSQRLCNVEFRRTITERADIAADDNAARKAQDQAVADLIAGVLSIEPGPDSRERSRAALTHYLDRFRANNARQADNERKRAENPYPRC